MKCIFLILVSLLLSAQVLADERSLYKFSWLDQDKEIYVLQNRKFRKVGNVYIGATGVKTLSGAFIDSYGGSLRAGYFFSEDWGLEFAFGKNSGTENDTAKGVKEQGTVPFYRKVDTYTGAMLMWSPFYSKINTFNKVFYFDWMFGLGAANVSTLDNRNKFNPSSFDEDTLTKENVLGILWNTGFRFYLSEHWSIRTDITGINYRANKTKKSQFASGTSNAEKIFGNYDLGIGLNYSF
ncbi:MAG TPA: outer membrane beta-barrel domain-containing protein [Bacteriovoracaceae bacterium]|nr:outer membrane beta-barrel domain-containing protein [Bacteriovoracaceae bacterium]